MNTPASGASTMGRRRATGSLSLLLLALVCLPATVFGVATSNTSTGTVSFTRLSTATATFTATSVTTSGTALPTRSHSPSASGSAVPSGTASVTLSRSGLTVTPSAPTSSTSVSTTVSPGPTATATFSNTLTQSGSGTMSHPTVSTSLTFTFSRSRATVSSSSSRTATRTSSVTSSESESDSLTVSASASVSSSESDSLSTTVSPSASETESATTTLSASASDSASTSQSSTVSESESVSDSMTTSASESSTASASESVSESSTMSASESVSTSSSVSVSESVSDSTSTSASTSETASASTSESESFPILSRMDEAGFFIFTGTFNNSYTAKRFLVRSTGANAGEQLRLSWHTVGSRSDLILQLAHTTRTFDYVQVGGLRCSQFADLEGTQATSVAPSLFACRAVNTCFMRRSAVAGPHRIDLELGPAHRQPSCDPRLLGVGIVAIRGEFRTQPRYFTAELSASSTGAAAASSASPVTVVPTLVATTTSTAMPSTAANSSTATPSSTPVAFTLTERAVRTAAPPGLSQSNPAVTCRVDDVTAFDVRSGVGIGDIAPCALAIEGGGTRSCVTTEDFHYACMLSLDCVGYSVRVTSDAGDAITNVEGRTFREVPLYLHNRYHGFRHEATIPSLREFGAGTLSVRFFEKPQELSRRCTFPVDESGEVTVYVAQTNMAANFVQIVVPDPSTGDPQTVAECGVLRPFQALTASGTPYFGRSGDCAALAPCHVANITAGSSVSVIVGASMRQDRCDDPGHVVVQLKPSTTNTNTTTAAPSNSTTNQTASPPPVAAVYMPVNVAGLESRPAYVASTSAAFVTVNAFVHNVTSVLLRVLQTAYDCSNRDDCGDDRSVVDIYVNDLGSSSSATTSNSLGERIGGCGGAQGFANGRGLSGQCGLGYDCIAERGTVPLPRVPFTGIVSLRLDADFIRDAPRAFTLDSFCTEFNANLFAGRGPVVIGTSTGNDTTSSSNVSSTSTLPVFPLVLTGGDQSPALVAFSPGDTANGTVWKANASLALVGNAALESLFSFGPLGTTFTMQYVRWLDAGQTPSAVALSDALRPNVTFACLADFISAAVHRCVVPVPAEANAISFTVAQTDFSANEVTLKFYDGNSVVDIERTVVCGAARGFVGSAGAKSDCSTYLTCVATFMYRDNQPVGSYRTVEVSVPNTVRSQGCPLAFASLVEFSKKSFSPEGNCTGYFCSADRNCIPRDRVCDGLSADCSDLADEFGCGSWLLAHTEFRFTTSLPKVRVLANATLLSCRQSAIVELSEAFSFTSTTGECEILSVGRSRILHASPSLYLTRNREAANATRIFVRVDDSSEYAKCSAELHCSQNGVLANPNALDGDRCTCTCDPRYTGTDCSVLKIAGKTSSLFAVTARRENEPFVKAAVESALAAGNRAVTIAVSAFVTYNATHAAVPFSYSSFDITVSTSYRNAIFTSAALRTINRELTNLQQPPIAFIFGADGANTFSSVATCSLNATSSAAAAATSQSCAVASTDSSDVVGNVLLSTYGFQSFAVDLTTQDPTAATGTRRQLSSTVSSVECFATAVTRYASTRANLLEACFPATCVIPVNAPLVSIGIREDPATAVVNGSTCPPASTSAVVLGTDVLPVIRLAMNATAAITESRDQQLASGAGGTIAAVVFCGFAGAAMVFLVVRGLDAARKRLGSKRLKRARGWFAKAIATESAMADARVDTESLAITCFVILVILLCVTGLLFVLFATSDSIDSNYSVLAEFYESSACSGGNAVRTLPLRAAAVAATGVCNPVSFVGESEAAVFAVATCDTPGFVSIALGGTAALCRNAPVRTFPADTCVPAASLQTGTEGYWRLRCAEAGTVSDSLASLAASSPTIAQTRDFEAPDFPPASLLPSSSSSTGVFVNPFMTRKTTRRATSHAGNVLSSIHSVDFFEGAFVPTRLLAQTSSTFLEPDEVTAASQSVVDALEARYLPVANRLPTSVIANVTPTTADYPLGYVFGAFGTVNEVTGASAGPSSHRYFGMQGSPFDIGRSFGPDDGKDLAGFTISLWLRASTDTRGFAFVLTDYFEDVLTETSPVVERLMSIAAEGPAPSREWFNSTFHVYASLYVDGAGRSLALHMIDPASEASASGNEPAFVRAAWDLEALGLERLVNGQWHHVSLGFRNENRNTYVVIGVDGESSLSQSGWRACLDRRPTAIQPLRNVKVPEGTDAIRYKALDGGVMYVGYFNGGVQGLTFTPTFETKDIAVRAGTRQMRIFNAFRRTTVFAIFYGMVFFAAIAFFAIARHAVKLFGDAQIADAAAMATVEDRYANNLHRLYGPYTPLCFEGLKEALELPDVVFSILLDECILSPQDDGEYSHDAMKLVRTVYNREFKERLKDPVLSASTPTMEEWDVILDIYNGDDAKLDSRRKSMGRMSTAGAKTSSGGAQAAHPALMSVIFTLQAASIYVSTWSTPGNYKETIGPYLNIFLLDFFGDNALVGPLVLLVLAVLLLSALAYVLIKDDERFFANAAKYQHQRDRVNVALKAGRDSIAPSFMTAAKRKASQAAAAPASVEDDDAAATSARSEEGPGARLLRQRSMLIQRVAPELYELIRCAYRYLEYLVKPIERSRLHQFAAMSKDPGTLHLSGGDIALPTIVTRADKGGDLTVALDTAHDDVSEDPLLRKPSYEPVDRNPEAERSLSWVTHRCRHHGTPLIPLDQTDVSPFTNRRTCCVVNTDTDAQCTTHTGRMWICVAKVEENENRRVCGYAVCDDHLNTKWYARLFLLGAGAAFRRLQHGPAWLLMYAAITLAIALYTPVMRACVMILACHPLYQCAFPMCWREIDQTFAAAAYLCTVIVIAYGIGYPVSMSVVLRRRVSALEEVFKAPMYDGAYMKPLPDGAVDPDMQRIRITASRAYRVARWLRHRFGFAARGAAAASDRRQRQSTEAPPLIAIAPVVANDESAGHDVPLPAGSDEDLRGSQNTGAAFSVPGTPKTEKNPFSAQATAGGDFDGGDRSGSVNRVDVASTRSTRSSEEEDVRTALTAAQQPGASATASTTTYGGGGARADSLSLSVSAAMSPPVRAVETNVSYEVPVITSLDVGDHGDDVDALKVSSIADRPIVVEDIKSPGLRPLDQSGNGRPAVSFGGLSEDEEGTADPHGDNARLAAAGARGPPQRRQPPSLMVVSVGDQPLTSGGGEGGSPTFGAMTRSEGDDAPNASPFGAFKAIARSTAELNRLQSTARRGRRASVNVAVSETRKSDYVEDAEWQRFLIADVSALTPLYETIRFERMPYVALLHCSKFILLIPPILLEPNSFTQLLFIAIGETVYACALTTGEPYVTPWMSIIVNLSNVHQFLLVAYQAYFVGYQNERDVGPGLAPAMLGTTIAYVCLVVLCLMAMVGTPVAEKLYGKLAANRLFKKYGMPRLKNMLLYVYPAGGTVKVDTAAEEDDPATTTKSRSMHFDAAPEFGQGFCKSVGTFDDDDDNTAGDGDAAAADDDGHDDDAAPPPKQQPDPVASDEEEEEAREKEEEEKNNHVAEAPAPIAVDDV